MDGELENHLLPVPSNSGRGDRLRIIQLSDQECVNGFSNHDDFRSKLSVRSEHTPKSPLKRGLLITIAVLIVIFTGAFTNTLHAQGFESSPNQENTPLSLPLLGETSQYPQLEEYLQIAIEQNPELQSLQFLFEAERERANEFGVMPDPELNINYDFNPMMSESRLGRFSVSAMQMFPWFGTLGSKKEAQQFSAEAQRSMIDSRQLEILRDIQITWFDIAEVEEQIRIADETFKLVGDLEQLVEIRYETASTGQADILRIQMEKQRIQNRIENLEDKLWPLRAKFNELLNRETGEEVISAEPQQQAELPYSAEEIAQLAKNQNPVFETLSLQESALQQQERTAELSGRPSFGIGLEVMGRDFGPMSMFPDSKESFIGMATIRLPIYRSRTKSQKQQISSRLQAVEMERVQAENRISSDLESTQETLRSSNRSIELLDNELIPRARQVLDILSEEYTSGNARFDELLQIQRELLDLEFERVEAVVNQNKAMARIERLVGGLRNEFRD
ncbi:TolC family protein [Rhodohalobacter barkolensis]|nr:TolC family protein [Rhodohalobacter barkolensis]